MGSFNSGTVYTRYLRSRLLKQGPLEDDRPLGCIRVCRVSWHTHTSETTNKNAK